MYMKQGELTGAQTRKSNPLRFQCGNIILSKGHRFHLKPKTKGYKMPAERLNSIHTEIHEYMQDGSIYSECGQRFQIHENASDL